MEKKALGKGLGALLPILQVKPTYRGDRCPEDTDRHDCPQSLSTTTHLPTRRTR